MLYPTIKACLQAAPIIRNNKLCIPGESEPFKILKVIAEQLDIHYSRISLRFWKETGWFCTKWLYVEKVKFIR